MSKRKQNDAMRGETKVVGYGYVGKWRDGTLGWCLPNHLVGDKQKNEEPSGNFYAHAFPDDRAVLCRITVEQVFAKNGRPIIRKSARSAEGARHAE